jgi:hypothetical protein
MAFDATKFDCVTNVNGWSQWHYRSAVDALAAIRASGYFNAFANVINTGDLLFIGPDSAGAGGFDMLINTGGVITVAAPALAGTDALSGEGADEALKALREEKVYVGGATGTTGATGATGATGDTGPTGDTGATGAAHHRNQGRGK